MKIATARLPFVSIHHRSMAPPVPLVLGTSGAVAALSARIVASPLPPRNPQRSSGGRGQVHCFRDPRVFSHLGRQTPQSSAGRTSALTRCWRMTGGVCMTLVIGCGANGDGPGPRPWSGRWQQPAPFDRRARVAVLQVGNHQELRPPRVPQRQPAHRRCRRGPLRGRLPQHPRAGAPPQLEAAGFEVSYMSVLCMRHLRVIQAPPA